MSLGNPKFITWSPVKRSDIAWNFEKFLIGPDGAPVKRYSRSYISSFLKFIIWNIFRYFLTSHIEEDIQNLLGDH